MRNFSLLLFLALTLTACASSPEQGRELTEARHYGEARELLDRKSYLGAIDALEEVEARFPYGAFTQQVQLDLIYARFKALDYPEAIAQADRFIRTYPAHPRLDYALYMKGLANFHLDLGLFDRILATDKASRDLTAMSEAFEDFSELVRRFPDSEFVADSHQRMLYIRNLLAEHELRAARYYALRGAFVAAANRAQFVIRHFQQTPAVPEALAVLSKAYEELGQPELAEKSARVLQYNWPDSRFFNSRDQVDIAWWPSGDKSWLGLITFDLLD